MKTTLAPSQRMPEPSCPFGCEADHFGELPGERGHSVPLATIRHDDGVWCVDMSVRDGEQPVIVVHEPDGAEVRIPEHVAQAVGNAILAAAGISWAVA